MTLMPAEAARITVPSGEWVEGEVQTACCNPQCDRPGTQTHHVVRRSHTGGPVRWIAIDGLVLLNEHRVCLWCHEDLNNHSAWIRYFTGQGLLWYAAAASGALATPASIADETWIQHPKSGRWFRCTGALKGV